MEICKSKFLDHLLITSICQIREADLGDKSVKFKIYISHQLYAVDTKKETDEFENKYNFPHSKFAYLDLWSRVGQLDKFSLFIEYGKQFLFKWV